jgi:uncharacterized protein YndB with AHSA1/START domain
VARVVRRRRIAAAPAEVWRVVSDPHHMPRWWPGTKRVENVSGEREGLSWTQVLGTRGGRGVRADYRCLRFDDDERFAFEQQLDGTPFAKHLRAMTMELELAPAEGGSEVSLSRDMRLRGLSRLGSPLMSRGAGRILNDALAGLDSVVTGADEG